MNLVESCIQWTDERFCKFNLKEGTSNGRRKKPDSLYAIEDKVCVHPAVKECVAVEVKDIEEEHVPMVFVALNDSNIDSEKVKESILSKCRGELKEYEVPKYIQIVEELPYTQNNKYDFRALEIIGNQYVDNLGLN